ncbi:MAG TPA: hypothetical protein VLA31_06915, partial [Burkholderiaceae bacterium]|nr:hypothetical protein [Burkholderiaceae bacterium]
MGIRTGGPEHFSLPSQEAWWQIAMHLCTASLVNRPQRLDSRQWWAYLASRLSYPPWVIANMALTQPTPHITVGESRPWLAAMVSSQAVRELDWRALAQFYQPQHPLLHLCPATSTVVGHAPSEAQSADRGLPATSYLHAFHILRARLPDLVHPLTTRVLPVQRLRLRLLAALCDYFEQQTLPLGIPLDQVERYESDFRFACLSKLDRELATPFRPNDGDPIALRLHQCTESQARQARQALCVVEPQPALHRRLWSDVITEPRRPALVVVGLNRFHMPPELFTALVFAYRARLRREPIGAREVLLLLALPPVPHDLPEEVGAHLLAWVAGTIQALK